MPEVDTLTRSPRPPLMPGTELPPGGRWISRASIRPILTDPDSARGSAGSNVLEMVERIRAHGYDLRCPLMIDGTQHPGAGMQFPGFKLLDGHHRFAALGRMGFDEVPVVDAPEQIRAALAATVNETVKEQEGRNLSRALAELRSSTTVSPKGSSTAGFGGQYPGKERQGSRHRGWAEMPVRMSETTATHVERCLGRSWWRRGKLQVVSVLAVFEADIGPEWKVAVRRLPNARPKAADVERVLRDFGMRDATEYNAFPSAWRSFFLAVDRSRSRANRISYQPEEVITEADGYRWANSINGPCRGCLYAISAKGAQPCSIHGAQLRLGEAR